MLGFKKLGRTKEIDFIVGSQHGLSHDAIVDGDQGELYVSIRKRREPNELRELDEHSDSEVKNLLEKEKFKIVEALIDSADASEVLLQKILIQVANVRHVEFTLKLIPRVNLETQIQGLLLATQRVYKYEPSATQSPYPRIGFGIHNNLNQKIDDSDSQKYVHENSTIPAKAFFQHAINNLNPTLLACVIGVFDFSWDSTMIETIYRAFKTYPQFKDNVFNAQANYEGDPATKTTIGLLGEIKEQLIVLQNKLDQFERDCQTTSSSALSASSQDTTTTSAVSVLDSTTMLSFAFSGSVSSAAISGASEGQSTDAMSIVTSTSITSSDTTHSSRTNRKDINGGP